MKKFIKIFLISAFCILAIVSILYVSNPNNDENSLIHKIRSRFRFRIEIGPRPYYRDDYYYRHHYYYNLARVECEIYNTNNQIVTEVSVSGRRIYLNGGYETSQRFYINLRPGYHTIRWRVLENESDIRNYSRRIRILRYERNKYIRISGSNFYIR